MKKALFAGTFDPPTLGHVDLIRRAAALFGKLEIAVAVKSSKSGAALTAEQRVVLLRKAVEGVSNVEIFPFSGLAVDFARKREADVLLRGIRDGADADAEMRMASANRLMTGIETIFLISSPEYSQINSTLIREIAAGGRSLKPFVPEAIHEEVMKLLTLKQE